MNDRNTIQTSLEPKKRKFVQRVTKIYYIIKGRVE